MAFHFQQWNPFSTQKPEGSFKLNKTHCFPSLCKISQKFWGFPLRTEKKKSLNIQLWLRPWVMCPSDPSSLAPHLAPCSSQNHLHSALQGSELFLPWRLRGAVLFPYVCKGHSLSAAVSQISPPRTGRPSCITSPKQWLHPLLTPSSHISNKSSLFLMFEFSFEIIFFTCIYLWLLGSMLMP